ncbi:MAG: 50S ribosomal protein L13 [Candidatus Woesearchaeota archaeon]
MKIINGEGLILGRVCTEAAKAALSGEEVKIVNCEKIIVSGEKQKIFAHEKEKRDRKGYPLKSAKFSKLSDRFVRRTVRGMLPFKTARGKEAYRRVMCHIAVPEEFKEQMKTIEKANANKLPTLKYTTIGAVSNWLRGKK